MVNCDECLCLIDLDEAAECETCGVTFCPDCSGIYTVSPICKECYDSEDHEEE